MASKKPGQNIEYMHPTDWEMYGANDHTVRLAWLDRVLVNADKATSIGSDINLVSVEVPEDL